MKLMQSQINNVAHQWLHYLITFKSFKPIALQLLGPGPLENS